MLKTKSDLKYYIQADRSAQNISNKYRRPKLFGHTFWKFTILLRKCEFHINNHHVIKSKIYRYLLIKKCYKYSSFIEPNVFGPGLCIAHWGGIAVSGRAKVGNNCYIHQCVTIGVKDGDNKAPTIGNNVVIGAGAVLLGDIKIADGVCIGANAVVVKDIVEPNTTWAGVPAKKITNKGTEGMIKYGN